VVNTGKGYNMGSVTRGGVRRLAKNAGITVMIALALLGLWIARIVVSGTQSVFFIVPYARLTADGRAASGWLHREIRGNVVIVTLNAGRERECYIVDLKPAEPYYSASKCSPWTAPRLPIVTTGDFFEGMEMAPPERNVVVQSGVIEFTADGGKRIVVRW